MPKIKVMSKVLTIRENEKQLAQLAHHQSVEVFEDTATKLYHLLKTKEDAKESYEKSIQNQTSIDKIKEYANYIGYLNNNINHLQQDVQKARITMENKQHELTNAYVEVKKFEKIIELRSNEQRIIAHNKEQISMDEISTQQYVRGNTGEYSGQTI